MTPILPIKQRRPYRAPTGLPGGRDDWRMGSVVATLVHLGIMLLLFAPMAFVGDVREIAQGAGGPGPAGGGGGGNRGTGALRTELLRFVRLAPPEAPAVVQVPVKAVPPPPEPVPEPPVPQPPVETVTPPAPTMPTGTRGGTGVDTTGGTGSGTGGGVGTGTGTGRGSNVGAGTGGGNQENYPPTPTEIFIPPLPVPGSVKGHHLIAEFDVDEKGKVLSMTFNETRDRGYNRRLAEVLRGFRFKPGTTPDGRAIRMKAQVIVDLY